MKHNKHTTSSSSSGGIGILGVLQIIFIVLKCLDLITWPWKVVLIPTWISLGLALVWQHFASQSLLVVPCIMHAIKEHHYE